MYCILQQHCTFCQKKSNFSYISNYITGYCIRCTCNSYFHITCGYREGVRFVVDEQSKQPKVTCKRCRKKMSSKKVRNLTELELETLVVTKCEDVYTYGRVVEIKEVLLHRVSFVDNTSADDIKSCDILVRLHLYLSKHLLTSFACDHFRIGTARRICLKLETLWKLFGTKPSCMANIQETISVRCTQ